MEKNTKDRAIRLLKAGYPIVDIVEELKPEWPKANRFTLGNWKDKYVGEDGAVSDIKKQIATLASGRQSEASARKIAMLTKSLSRLESKDKKDKKEKIAPKPAQLVVMQEMTRMLKTQMAEAEYGLYPYQVKFMADDSRFRVWLKSRQIGATYGCSGECLAEAMGGLDQLIISASEEQALKWSSEIKKHAEKLGIVLGGSESKITTPAGTTIYIFANNFRTIQGFSGSVWLDEFAWYTNCKRIWEAFMPSITSVKVEDTAARVTILSTPFEESSLFHRLITDTEKYHMFSRHITTIHDAVADGLIVDVDTLRDLFDADSWAMMYECQFVDDESALLPISLIKSCVNDRLKFGAQSTEALRAGYDIGRKIDLSVLAAFAQRQKDEAAKPKFIMTHLDAYRKASFDAQKMAINTFLNYFTESMLRIDATGIGAMLAENAHKKYKKRAVEVLFTQASKETMALNLKKAFEDGLIEIPNDPLLIADLHAIKRKAGARGFIYDADRNEHGHADRFWACALALSHENFVGNGKNFDPKAAAEAMRKRTEAKKKLQQIKDKKGIRNAKKEDIVAGEQKQLYTLRAANQQGQTGFNDEGLLAA